MQEGEDYEFKKKDAKRNGNSSDSDSEFKS